MALAGLASYDASSGSEQQQAANDSEDSYFGTGHTSRRAAAKIAPHRGDERPSDARSTTQTQRRALGQLGGKPAFLDPSATRPIAESIHRGRPPAASMPEPRPAEGNAQPVWDIARMAPPAKSTAGGGAKSGAVISAAPVRNRQPADDDNDDDDGPGVATAAQIAMLGGQWKPSAEPQKPAAVGPAAPGQKRKPTPAMGLDSFIEKGGGAALPRSVPARRDKEQAKRMRGQSSHASWKSEAEMVLRQQYDS